jgi:recombination protein RecR
LDRSTPAPGAAFDNRPGGEFQSPSLERLVRALDRMPGIGRKSATRIALDLLNRENNLPTELSGAIAEARKNVRNCSRCGAITENDPCRICTSKNRDTSQLCIVATSVDILPFEKAGFYQGRYLVLGKLLSPLDGVRASDLPFDVLQQRVADDVVTEMILALDASVEGEATALYIQRMFVESDIGITRLATGIPVGGSLAYTDEATLHRAFQFRRKF